MTARAVIEEATKAGIRLSLNGDNLKLNSSAKLPDDLLARLREHKLSIVAILKQNATESKPREPDEAASAATSL